MANSIVTPKVIAKEALLQLENNLVMGNCVHRDYKEEFIKVGDTVSIRKPVRFLAKDGATLQKQDVEEATTSLAVNKRKHVGWAFNSEDLSMSIDEYAERYIRPAMVVLANQIDADLLGLYASVWNWAGTPGQTVNAFGDLAKAPERLDHMAVPRADRQGVLSPTDAWALASAQTALFMPDKASEAYEDAKLGRIAGLDLYQDQNVKTHVVGDHGGTPLVDGASQDVTYAASKETNTQTLITDGWATSKVLKAGDVFTIDGVYAVNPVSKQVLPFLQQFVLVNDVTTNANAANDTNLTIAPAIIASGPYQNVSAAPANNAPITYAGTANTGYPQNLVFHRNAFALVTIPLEMPDGVAFKAREVSNGLSVRVIKDYDIVNDEDVIRIDVFYGVKAIYPDLAVRLSGSA